MAGSVKFVQHEMESTASSLNIWSLYKSWNLVSKQSSTFFGVSFFCMPTNSSKERPWTTNQNVQVAGQEQCLNLKFTGHYISETDWIYLTSCHKYGCCSSWRLTEAGKRSAGSSMQRNHVESGNPSAAGPCRASRRELLSCQNKTKKCSENVITWQSWSVSVWQPMALSAIFSNSNS